MLKIASCGIGFERVLGEEEEG